MTYDELVKWHTLESCYNPAVRDALVIVELAQAELWNTHSGGIRSAEGLAVLGRIHTYLSAPNRAAYERMRDIPGVSSTKYRVIVGWKLGELAIMNRFLISSMVRQFDVKVKLLRMTYGLNDVQAREALREIREQREAGNLEA